MKKAAVKHPLIFSIIITLIFELSLQGTGVLFVMFGPDFLFTNGMFVTQGSIECVCALVGIGVVYILGFGKIWNEKGKGFARGLDCGAYFIFVSLLTLISSLLSVIIIDAQFEPIWKIAVFVITVFLIGLTEESFFRGAVANLFFEKHGKDPAGVWCAVIGSGLVFGLMHITNILSADVVGVLVQVFAATFMGMTLTAIYFRCRNIWVLIFIHGFVDFCGAFTAGVLQGGSLSEVIGSYSPEMCASALPYLIVTLFLLRPKKMREIIAMRNSDGQEELPERLVSAKRSKIGLALAIVALTLIEASLYLASIYFYNH